MAGKPCTYSKVEIGACFACIRGKRKCDKQRPCSRCVQRGRPEDCCGPEKDAADSQSPDSMQAEETRLVILDSQCSGDSNTSPTQTDWFLPASPPQMDLFVPQLPIPFPREGSVESPLPFWRKLPPLPVCNYPKGFLAMICAVRSDVLCRMLSNMTPRLREAIRKVFGALDEMRSTSQGQELLIGPISAASSPCAEEGWTDLRTWQHSARCGYAVSTMHPETGTIGFRNANDYWIDIAGMHREEFFARMHNSQLDLASSELRTFCKVIQGALDTLPSMLGGKSGRKTEVEYRHIRKNWGKGSGGESILTRQSTEFKYRGCSLQTVAQSCTVISPEEYDAAASQAPDSCERLAAVVIGRKSGRALLSPDIIATESFVQLNATEEGRRGLDRLADTMEGLFGPLLSATNQIRRVALPPTRTCMSQRTCPPVSSQHSQAR